VDPGSVKYFADSLMDPDPASRRPSVPGPVAGGGLVAPPTFFGGATGLIEIPAGDSRTMFQLVLPIPEGWTAIASGDEFDFLAPVRAGMTLVCQERFEDAYEKQGSTGRLIFFTVVKSFTTDDGATLLRRKLHCVARPPHPQAAPALGTLPVRQTAPDSQLPAVAVGPVTIRYLAMFATATAEFVDIHYDADHARSLGLPGAIIQGLYKTALAARMVKDWTGDAEALRRLSVQHRRMDLAGSTLTAGGAIISPMPQSLPADVSCRIWVHNQHGIVTTRGTADLTLPANARTAAWLNRASTKEHVSA
jgi:acyl dehydratase